MGAVDYYRAGFTAQVSVMPPGAKVSPNSKLQEKDAGKAPALKGRDGRYFGYNWMNSRPTLENVQTWIAQGTSIGFLASHYPAIDIDIMNPDISEAVVAATTEAMGPCLMRTGQAPKRLLIFRCDEPLRSFDMHYERWSDLLGAADKHLIQFLGKGRQYVMDGIHPGTLQPYTIADPNFALTLGPGSLPTLTPAKVVELFDIINEVMARFGFTCTSNAEARVTGSEVDQDDLKAPTMSDLSELVGRMPNTVPDRDEYVAVGYAIKAASQDDPEVGFDLFMSWCERWADGANDPSVVRRDWDKMVPPYRMGYDWLMSRAKMWGADISDLQFGKGLPRPEGGPLSVPAEEDASAVEASRAALQVAALADDAVLSDRWLAQKFISQFGREYMVPRGMANGLCFKWDGTHWVVRPRGALTSHIGSFMASHTAMARQAFENPKEAASAAMRLGSARTIHAVQALVLAQPSMAPEMDYLDAEPDLLDTPQGPIHLPTGNVLKPDPKYLLTKATSVAMDPSGYCPRWLQFIREVTQNDPQLAFYLQCLAGYCLTGHTREQVFPFFVGPGGNGKSVFINILARVLGKNAVSVPVELFQLSRFGNDTPYLLAQLHGARLVTTSETKSGGMWDEQRVKQVTGEDIISARVPYGQPFEFKAQCTLIVVGNYSPDLEAVTDAMTRRVKVVPWEYKPDHVDRMLTDKLLAELPGILAWCVEGAKAWYTHGLPACADIESATQGYIADQDTMGQWITDVISVGGAEDFVSNKELYDSFAAWCRGNGMMACNSATFTKRIVGPFRALGARHHRFSMQRGWKWLKLAPVHDAPPNIINFPAVAAPPPRQ